MVLNISIGQVHYVKKWVISLLLLCGILLSSQFVHAINNIQFRHLSVQDGLSQSTVYDISQDKYGFMWFATTNGLNKFDGYKFTHYFAGPEETSLNSNTIYKLLYDRQNNLWIGTGTGLSRYHENTDTFTNYSGSQGLDSSSIYDIFQDSKDNLWVTTDLGVYKLALGADKFLPQVDTNSNPITEVRNVTETRQGDILLGTVGRGMYKLAGTQFQEYQFEGLEFSSLYAALELDDELWISTEKGVYRYNASTQSLTLLETPKLPQGTLILNMTHDNQHVWMGSEQGLLIYDKSNQSLRLVTQYSDYPNSIRSNVVLSSFHDAAGSIWIGTYNGGIHKYNDLIAQFKHYQAIPNSEFGLSDNMVFSFDEDLQGNVWVASQNGGINKFSPETGLFEQHLTDFNANIWNLSVIESGLIFLSTDLGIYIFNPATEDLRYLDLKVDMGNITGIRHFKDKIWIGTDGNGLYIYRVNSGVVSQVINKPELNEGTISPLMIDDQLRLWLTKITAYGTQVFTLDTETMELEQQKEIPQDIYVFDIAETDNAYWIGSQYSGLFKLDKNTRELSNITVEDGLSNNSIAALETVKQQLWIATFKGLNRLDLNTGKIVNYYKQFGLDGNEFNERASLINSKGLLFFGGNNGMNIILNTNMYISSSNYASKAPTITEFNIANQPTLAAVDKGQKKQQAIFSTDRLFLTSKQTPFSFSFAQTYALEPELIEYRYRMLGYLEDWIEVNSLERKAFFANLPFGEYEFEVQARSHEQDWGNSRKLSIEILPPVWLSPAAILFYGLCAGLICIYLFRHYQQRKNIRLQVAESEERLSLALWGSGDEMWDWDIENGIIVRSNSWELIDFPSTCSSDLENPEHHSNIHPNDISKVKTALRGHFEQQSNHYEVSYRVKDKTDNWLWVLDRGRIVELDGQGKPARMTGTLKNISEIKKAEDRLNMLARSISNISDGMFILNKSFEIIEVNEAYCKITGVNRTEVIGQKLEFSHYNEQFVQQIKRSLFSGGRWNGEIESSKVDGSTYFVELNIDAMFNKDGDLENFVGVFSDITYRKRTEKELRELANIDILTKLPNRSFFEASHHNLVDKNIAHTLIVLDLDDFKKVNDSQGHKAGDEMIKQTAIRLRQALPIQYTLYRLGGDEFAIIVETVEGISQVTHQCQKILNVMSRPFQVNQQEYNMTCSLGIASFPNDGENPESLLKNADTAMYFAKDKGGNLYQFFSESMNKDAVRRVQIENLIRYGLKEDLFSVFYQPKVDIATNRLVGMESLVRFLHPEKGIVSPAQFIPFAEENGQILEIGEVVLRKACFATKAWLDAGLFKGRVAVNLSARQFSLKDICERIDYILNLTGLPARHLELEITEGTLMDSPKDAIEIMYQLRARGIHLALDDFGTGYSSLSYLKQFPINTLKIDKAFIDDIEHSEKDLKMADSITTIAHNLGLSVVAEGVEKEAQLNILKKLGCETVQGYIYSKPVSEQKFAEMLKDNSALKKHIEQQGSL